MSQQINLFNPIFLKQKKIFTARPMAEALGVVLLGAVLLAWVATGRVNQLQLRADAGKAELAARETRLNQAAAQFAPRQPSPQLASELAQAQVELKALKDVENVLNGGTLGNTSGYAEYFRALARQNLPGLWLTGVSIVGAGTDIGVQGRAMQPTLIPNYIARLTSEKVMRGKTFGSLKINRPSSGDQPAGQPAPAVPPPPVSPQLAALAGLDLGTPKAPAARPVPVALVSATAPPYVEFSLQSAAASAPEAAK